MKIGTLTNLIEALGGCSPTFASAVKNGAIRAGVPVNKRRFDIDVVIEWYNAQPEFTITSIYPRKPKAKSNSRAKKESYPSEVKKGGGQQDSAFRHPRGPRRAA